MKLTGQQRQAMHRALLDAYPTRADLAMLVSFSMNELLDSIVAMSLTQPETVFELLVWAESRGALEELLTAAIEDRPGNAALASVASSLGFAHSSARTTSSSGRRENRGQTAVRTVQPEHATASAKRTYRIKDSTLSVEFGDIVSSSSDVLVSSDDYYLSMGGGVSRAILKAAGQSIALEAAKAAPADAGDVVVTGAGQLSRARHVFHAVTIGPSKSSSAQKILTKIIPRCFQLADALGVQSIAFPALGTGVARFSLDEVAASMANLIVDELEKRNRRLDVTIYLFDRFGERGPTDYLAFFEEFAARTPRIAATAGFAESSPRVAAPAPVQILATTAEQMRAQRLHQLYALIAQVHERRYQLEQQLVEQTSSVSTGDTAGIDRLLEQNGQLRRRFLAELEELSRADQPTASADVDVHTVFLSSTFSDLQRHRTAVKDQITKHGLLFKGMELFGADPDKAPADLIVDEVRRSDAFVGIIGARYGFIDGASGLSMTELEFNAARAAGKPMLLYVMAEEAPVPFKDIEQSAEGKTKLDAFRTRIMREHVVDKFITPEDLAAKVFADLGKIV